MRTRQRIIERPTAKRRKARQVRPKEKDGRSLSEKRSNPSDLLLRILSEAVEDMLKRKKLPKTFRTNAPSAASPFNIRSRTNQSASMSFATASGSVAQDVQKRTTQRPSGRWYQLEKTKSFSSRAFVASSRIGKIWFVGVST